MPIAPTHIESQQLYPPRTHREPVTHSGEYHQVGSSAYRRICVRASATTSFWRVTGWVRFDADGALHSDGLDCEVLAGTWWVRFDLSCRLHAFSC